MHFFYYLYRIFGQRCSPTRENSGIESTKDSLNIPYFMFVEDCSNICKASKQIARKVTYIPEHYSKVLNQLTDYHRLKSNFLQVFQNNKEERTDILHITHSSTIRTYLECTNTDKRRVDWILVEPNVKKKEEEKIGRTEGSHLIKGR